MNQNVIIDRLIESEIPFHTHITSTTNGHQHKAIVSNDGDGITEFMQGHSHLIKKFECQNSLEHSHLIIAMNGKNKLQESEGSEVQSILFQKSKYTLAQAKLWLKKHGYTSTKVDETDEYYRFRQSEPSQYDHFATDDWKNGLKVIYGYKKGDKIMKESVPIMLLGEYGTIKLYEAVDGKAPKYDAHITVLAEGFSKNRNPKTKKRRFYTKEAVKSLVKLMESESPVDVYDAPHMEGDRPSREKIGLLENPIYTEVEGKSFAEADLMLFNSAPLKEQIKYPPNAKKIGFSILADGTWDTEKVDNELVEAVKNVTVLDSVDYTSRPAAGGKVNHLYEAWQKSYEDNTNKDIIEETEDKEKLFESIFTGVVNEKLRESTTEEERKMQEERSKKYGIAVRYTGHVTKPTEYKNIPDESFADPVNYAYPIDSEHVMAAVRYWGHPDNQNKYSTEDRAIIEKRIEKALKKFGKNTKIKEGVIEVDFTELTIEVLKKERPDLVESIESKIIEDNDKKNKAVKLVETTIKASGLKEATQKILIDAYGDGTKPMDKLNESITAYKAEEAKLAEAFKPQTTEVDKKDKKSDSDKLTEAASKYV